MDHVEESWPLHCGLNYICENFNAFMHYGEQMMKFLAAFCVTSAFLFGIADFGVPSTKLELQPLVPSKIVDKKKAPPIRVPHTSCIVSVEGVAHTLEEHMLLCLSKRNWLEINIDHRDKTII